MSARSCARVSADERRLVRQGRARVDLSVGVDAEGIPSRVSEVVLHPGNAVDAARRPRGCRTRRLPGPRLRRPKHRPEQRRVPGEETVARSDARPRLWLHIRWWLLAPTRWAIDGISESSPRFSSVGTVVSETSKPRSARSFARPERPSNVPAPRMGSFVTGRAPSRET